MLKKLGSIGVVGVILTAAFLVGWAAFMSFYKHQHFRVINLEFCHVGFDIAAVGVIAFFSFFWNNLKLYEGYLALSPIVRYYFMHQIPSNMASRVDFNLKNLLYCAILTFYSVRLFARRFLVNWSGFPEHGARDTADGVGKGKLFFIWKNFKTAILTILLSTTLTLPIEIFSSRHDSLYLKPETYTLSELVSIVVAVAGLAIQHIADAEFLEWKKETANASATICDVGLRRYLRYPQYLGEFYFWLGVYGFGIGAYDTFIAYQYQLLPIGLMVYLIWVWSKVSQNDRILKSKVGGNLYLKAVRFSLIPFFRRRV